MQDGLEVTEILLTLMGITQFIRFLPPLMLR